MNELLEHRLAIDRHRNNLKIAMIEARHDYSYSLAQHSLYHICDRTHQMKKKIAETKKKTVKKADFVGFANVELSVEQKAEMKEWIRDLEAVQVELDEMAASSYKMSFNKSEATGGYQATAFCNDADSPNAGMILSAFAPHWFDALSCLAYKHAIACEGIWPQKGDEPREVWG
jgi:hypothetical protein